MVQTLDQNGRNIVTHGQEIIQSFHGQLQETDHQHFKYIFAEVIKYFFGTSVISSDFQLF